MTLYLKYRPQKISDLDLVAVREMLAKMVASAAMPHAFLFSGSRGLGKTSAARILARAVNCQNPEKGEPCNECDACREILSGASADLIEIDAASNRGIDEIRVLRDNINLAPMHLTTKVYIIDEVHMLTTEAANALLKTLEEPPDHAMFILCTTDPHKLPETVVSRCTHIPFGQPTLPETISRLDKIIKSEKLKVEPAALELIAAAGRGSFRDSVKILEQIVLTKDEVTVAGTRAVLGMMETADPQRFLDHVQAGQGSQALKIITKLTEGGVNIRTFIERCLEILRLQLMASLGKPEQKKILISLIEQLDQAYDRSKTSAVPQLPLEIFVIENSKVVSGDKYSVINEYPEEKMPGEKPVSEHRTLSTSTGKFKLEDVTSHWTEILKAVRPKNHSVEALLRSTTPVEFDGHDLLLEVFYKFHKDKLETEKCRQIVEEAVGDTFSVRPIRLKLRLGQKQSGKEEVTARVEEDIIKAAEEIFKVDAL